MQELKRSETKLGLNTAAAGQCAPSCVCFFVYIYIYVYILATDAEVPGSIPGTARVVVGLERGLLSLVSLLRSIEELLE